MQISPPSGIHICLWCNDVYNSRLEQRTDLCCQLCGSILQQWGENYAFPNRPPVTLVGFSEIEESEEGAIASE
ncbi:MAG: hypothetical protein KME30_08695 [Iphinoe sp. HA4291-MV1]|nr:hypothetical protein [Iphinoe sp. HA4291-MV1]